MLPSLNGSAYAENESFSDGQTNEVISDQARISALQVIAHDSSIMLKGTTKGSASLAREPQVTHFVTGMVRRQGNALQVTIELVDARADDSVSGGKVAGTMEDVRGIQEEI